MKSNNVMRTRRVLALVEAHGLDTIEELSVSSSYGTLRLTCYRQNVNEEHMRTIKRLFGPLEIEDEYSGKALTGTMKFDDEDFKCKFTIQGSYSCEKLEPKDMTEDKINDIVGKMKEGLIEVKDCSPVGGKGLEEDL